MGVLSFNLFVMLSATGLSNEEFKIPFLQQCMLTVKRIQNAARISYDFNSNNNYDQ